MLRISYIPSHLYIHSQPRGRGTHTHTHTYARIATMMANEYGRHIYKILTCIENMKLVSLIGSN